MREFFSQFGKVIDSTVMLDRETGRSKGFGFVSFEDTNVQPFLGFGNLEIDGKLVCPLLVRSSEDLPDVTAADRREARTAALPARQLPTRGRCRRRGRLRVRAAFIRGRRGRTLPRPGRGLPRRRC